MADYFFIIGLPEDKLTSLFERELSVEAFKQACEDIMPDILSNHPPQNRRSLPLDKSEQGEIINVRL